jgi:small-conductance mechanosensitive channel
LLSFGAIAAVWLLGRALKAIARLALGRRRNVLTQFWSEQAVHLFTTFVLVLLLISIWFSDPARLATAFGLISAGLAFALQRVITAFAGYFVILHGRLFNIGDRIKMGGVRGDVLSLGYLRTTVMEMGQAPGEQKDDPSMWVQSRQYTGRIVTVTNDKIFDDPVFNYTRDFPYIWEEMHLPVPYRSDRAKAEQILLETARRHSAEVGKLSQESLTELQRRYFMEKADVDPHVYWRMTDNWLQLSLRFIAPARRVRGIKDKMTREILAALDDAGIEVASATFELANLPPIRIERAPTNAVPQPA